MIATDACHDPVGKVWFPPWPSRRSRRRTSDVPPLGEEPLQLVDGDKSHPRSRLYRLDEREHPPVERRGAYAECFGGLASGVGEPLDARRLEHDRPLGGRGARERVALRLLRSAPWPAACHADTIHQL